MKFPKKKIRDVAKEVLLRNANLAHRENVLIAMLGNDGEEIHHLAVNKILAIRKITNESSDLVNEKLDDQQHNSSNSTSIVQKIHATKN